MAPEETISVIIPIYNMEAHLSRCVDSVLTQSYGTLEILLVDDGSTDGSGRLCDGYARQDQRVRVIHKENGGLSSARNAGLSAAQGAYLSLVDSDDWLEPETYRDMMNLLRQTGADMLCAGRFDVDSVTGEKTVGLCPPRQEVISGQELARRIFLWEGADSSACDKLYRRALFDNIRYPEGMTCEDVPVTYRLCLRAEKAAMLPRPVYNYYHRPESISTTAISEKNFHFAVHTEQILKDIAQTCPALLPEARYLRIRSLGHPLQLCIIAGKTNQYAALCRQHRQALRQQLGYILTSPLVSRKERLEFTALSLNFYGILWKVHLFLKQSKGNKLA